MTSDVAGLVSVDYLLTAFVVVLAPGIGVLYTLWVALFHGRRAGIAAAAGCTLGIVPHLVASVFGLAALLHTSAVAFQTLKLLGVAYLLYLAWGLWHSGIVAPEKHGDAPASAETSGKRRSFGSIALRGALINILNPKLSVFFLAFLPQFVPAAEAVALPHMLALGAVFMLITFAVFIGYGIAATWLRHLVTTSQRRTRWIARFFAAAYGGFALKLAATEN